MASIPQPFSNSFTNKDISGSSQVDQLGALEPIEFDVGELEGIIQDSELQKIDADLSIDGEADHFENLVEKIDDEEFLLNLGRNVVDRFQNDKNSRVNLENTLERGFGTLNPTANQTDTLPFQGACNIVHPLTRENGVKYQAKFCKALLPPQGPFNLDVIDSSKDPDIQYRVDGYRRKLNKIAVDDMCYPEEQARLYLYMSYTRICIQKGIF